MAKKNESPPKSEAPEKKTWKKRIIMTTDLEKLQHLELKDKITYLALYGWRMEMETRSGSEYLYAIKYIERKKHRIYLGKAIDIESLVVPE